MKNGACSKKLLVDLCVQKRELAFTTTFKIVLKRRLNGAKREFLPGNLVLAKQPDFGAFRCGRVVRLAHCAEIHHVNLRDVGHREHREQRPERHLGNRFFKQLALCPLFHRFVVLHETCRQRPFAKARFNAAQAKIEGLEERVAGGNFIDKTGKILGQHKGYPFYTIGQRKGLDIAFGHPVYVTGINPENNTVVLGEEDDLNRPGMMVTKLNWGKYEGISDGMEATTKIRYKDKGTLSNLYNTPQGIQVKFYEDAKGVAPGQSAVFYEGDDVIGGGFIDLIKS